VNIACPHERCVYIAIPKVACGSIKRAVAAGIELDGPERKIHSRAFGWQCLSKKEVLAKMDNGWLSWAFVRNPWDRLVSLWAHKIHRFAGKRKHSPWLPRLSTDMSWAEFVDWVASTRHYSRADEHVRPQRMFLLKGSHYLAQLTFRFETLPATWEQLRRMWGWPGLPRVNTSNHADYREMFTDAQRDKVARLCDPDADLLGYAFGDPPQQTRETSDDPA